MRADHATTATAPRRRRISPWLLVAAVWLWPAVFSVVERIAQTRLQGWSAPTPKDLWFSSVDWLLYGLVTPFIFRIARRWPVERPHIRRRVAVHFVFALLFCVVWAMGGKLFELLLTALYEPGALQAALQQPGTRIGAEVARQVSSWVLTTLPFGVVVYGTVAGVVHAIDYFAAARKREVEVARLSTQLSEARYAALQSQLNPHFLFNTLNTVIVLIRDGERRAAVSVVEQLSELLRHTLRPDQTNEVALDEELAVVQQYLGIEQARFSDRLRVTMTVDPEARRAFVPNMAVQHLVENAIRHGISKRADAGQLEIRAIIVRDLSPDGTLVSWLEVSVTDDGPGIHGDIQDDAVYTAGHGLDNTRQRLAALYGPAATLTVKTRRDVSPDGTASDAAAPTGTVATLRVPLYLPDTSEAISAGTS